jgi:hypothetical protein
MIGRPGSLNGLSQTFCFGGKRFDANPVTPCSGYDVN